VTVSHQGGAKARGVKKPEAKKEPRYNGLARRQNNEGGGTREKPAINGQVSGRRWEKERLRLGSYTPGEDRDDAEPSRRKRARGILHAEKAELGQPTSGEQKP